MSADHPSHVESLTSQTSKAALADNVVRAFAETDRLYRDMVSPELKERLGSTESLALVDFPFSRITNLTQRSTRRVPISTNPYTQRFRLMREYMIQKPQPSFRDCLILGGREALQELKQRTNITLDLREMTTLVGDVVSTVNQQASDYFPDSLRIPGELLGTFSAAKQESKLRRLFWFRLIEVCLPILCFLGLSVFLFFSWSRTWISDHLISVVSVGSALLGLCLVLFSFSSGRVHACARELQTKLQERESSRASFNRLLFDGIDALYADCLKWYLGANNMLQLPSEAPRLVETNTRDLHTTTACREVVDLLLEHESIAIGIVGRRGVGKTSMLEIVQDRAISAGHRTVFLPVPAVYTEESFLRALALRITARFCGMESDDYESDNRNTNSRSLLSSLGRKGLRPFIVGSMGVYVSLILVVLGVNYPSFLSKLNALVVFGIVLALVSVFYMFRGFVDWDSVRRLDRNFRGLRRVAYLLYRDLRYEWETTNETELLFKPTPLESRFTRSQKRQGRDLTYVEIADRLRGILQENSRQKHPEEITILIDELDKLPEEKQRVSLITVLKDLFHISHIRVVVTVAPEAQAAFADRQFAFERTVYDTAFDEIITVSEPTAVDTCGILQKRVPEFPDGLALFCHCVAGGNPRDAIRVARKLLAARKKAEKEFSLKSTLQSITKDTWHYGADGPLAAIAESVIQLTLDQVSPDGEWQAEASSDDFLEIDEITNEVRELSLGHEEYSPVSDQKQETYPFHTTYM